MKRLIVTILATISPVCGQAAWRAVWVESDPDAPGGAGRIMSREVGKPARPLTGKDLPGTRPLISADGNTVFFSSLRQESGPDGTSYDPLIFSVPFAGGEGKELSPGLALAVRPEGNTSAIYALASLQTGKKPVPTGDMLIKFLPETPGDREIIWAESSVSADNFQLSRDGRRAGGMFPWPQAGLANLEEDTFIPVAQGSFPALCPDDSCALAMLSPDRRKIRIFAPGVTPDWELDPAAHLPDKKAALNHLRWTSDPLHLAFTVPEGESAGVYLAEVRADLKAVTAATRISETVASAMWPDAWLPGSAARRLSLPQKPEIKPPAPTATWPASTDALVFAWEKSGAPTNTTAFIPEGYALPGRGGSMDISAGRSSAPPVIAEKIASACAQSGAFTLQALITERRSGLPCSRRFITLADAAGQDFCALYRVDGHLVLRLRTGAGESALTERITLSPFSIEDDRPFFITLTLHGRALTCYADGVKMKDFQLNQAGLATWQNRATLYAGDSAPYGEIVPGLIGRMAIYSRALAATEAAEAWQAVESELPARPTRHKVKLKLLTPAPPVDAAALNTPATTMAAGTWTVEQVFTGFVKPQTIALLQWSVINGKPGTFPAMQKGQSIELFISDIEDHPGLRSLPAQFADGAAALPLYFDTTVAGRHPTPFPP